MLQQLVLIFGLRVSGFEGYDLAFQGLGFTVFFGGLGFRLLGFRA